MAVVTLLADYWQAIAAILVGFGALIYGRHQRGAGATERETKLRADASARQMEAVTDATEANARVHDADPAELERLRGKWRRP